MQIYATNKKFDKAIRMFDQVLKASKLISKSDPLIETFLLKEKYQFLVLKQIQEKKKILSGDKGSQKGLKTSKEAEMCLLNIC